MNSKTVRTILLVVSDTTLNYLFRRFAERSEFQLTVTAGDTSFKEIKALNPTVIIFSSLELLEKTQSRATEWTSIEIPIIVCSSVMEEARARELGADYCLLHPLTYGDFQTALAQVDVSKPD